VASGFRTRSCAQKGKRSAERRIVQPMSALRKQVCAVCATQSATRLRDLFAEARPPFGAHACGTRHRLSPRWLSPRTGFPEDGPSLSVLPAWPFRLRLSTLRADRSFCRSTGDPEPPGSGWHIRARAPLLASVFQACPSGKAPSMTRGDRHVTVSVTPCKSCHVHSNVMQRDVQQPGLSAPKSEAQYPGANATPSFASLNPGYGD
jgi:hypothetical protein